MLDFLTVISTDIRNALEIRFVISHVRITDINHEYYHVKNIIIIAIENN